MYRVMFVLNNGDTPEIYQNNYGSSVSAQADADWLKINGYWFVNGVQVTGPFSTHVEAY